MSTKLAFTEEIFKSHEAAFIEHYDWLMRWSLQFNNHDRERAEDQVQQVFTQFAIAHTDLTAVQNIPAYLYTTLRNIHVSEVRLAGRSHHRSQSIVDYSVAEAALDATDPYTIFHTQDQLRRVCQYACLRKQSSRAGSVLILRYFHGYHLSEVAEILRTSFHAVRQQLTFARNEARVFLEDPRALRFMQQCSTLSVMPGNGVCSPDKLLIELRKAIFNSREGDCIGAETIQSLYVDGLIGAADNSTVAHIVSCPSCLDEVNARLGLPLLAERHPADTLGPNNDWRDGTRGPRDSGGSGSAVPSRRWGKNDDAKINGPFLAQCRRRATELFEHYPRELCVSINGHLLGSHSVSSPVSRLRLDVTIREELNFVEVLSEERTRLLVMPIDPPPDGEPVQYRRLRLSEGRQLEVTFHYGHPWPMVEVVYEEPNFVPESDPLVAREARAANLAAVESDTSEPQSSGAPKLLDFLRRFRLPKPFWLRPGFITAIISLVLVGILLTFWSQSRSITAAGLLERARAAESVPGAANTATHRVIELEQRRSRDGVVVARNRIDVWRDERRGISARRVYDQSGQLAGGVWIERKSGEDRSLRRIYRRGSGERIETGGENTANAIRDAELWQLDPSAIVFSAFVNGPDVARVSEKDDSYVIEYVPQQVRNDGLLQATLTLRKPDLHAVAQTLAITDGRETYDYKFTETSFERPSLDFVSPSVFAPDAELVSKTVTPSVARHNVALPSATEVVRQNAELEMNVAYALDRFRTRFGDQLSLVKTPAGLLEVKGVVDSDGTRKEILKELSLVNNDPASISIQLDTTAELLARKQTRLTVLKDFVASDESLPLYSELSRYFDAHEGAGQPAEYRDRLVRDFAAQLVGRSQRAVAHSLELKQLGARFSPVQLQQFTPSARARWFTLVRNHAEALRRELSTLDGELQRTLSKSEAGTPANARVEISDDASLLGEIERLHKFVLTVDQAVRSSFAASSGASGASRDDGVKSSRFSTALATSIRITDEIRRAVADK